MTGWYMEVGTIYYDSVEYLRGSTNGSIYYGFTWIHLYMD